MRRALTFRTPAITCTCTRALRVEIARSDPRVTGVVLHVSQTALPTRRLYRARSLDSKLMATIEPVTAPRTPPALGEPDPAPPHASPEPGDITANTHATNDR